MESQRQKELSEKARQNLQRNSGLREKEGGSSSKFAKIQPGAKVIWLFDAEKIEPVEQEFDGKKVQKFQYAVVDPNDPGQERYWTASKTTSEQIDAYLSEGHTLLKIQRIGLGKETRYNIMPA
jgi:hypothetical protein